MDRYHIGVIGYGDDAVSLLQSDSGESQLVKISELADSPLRTESRSSKVFDGAGGFREHEVVFPVWFEPMASGQTRMREAIDLAATFAEDFIVEHPECRPPIVFNITDGAPHEPDPTEQAAKQLRSITSSDGNLLLFNVHISHLPLPAIEFPTSPDQLPDRCAKMLYRMSSTVPTGMQIIARLLDFQIDSESRGFVFNANLDSVVRFLDAGTRHTQPRRLGHTP